MSYINDSYSINCQFSETINGYLNIDDSSMDQNIY